MNNHNLYSVLPIKGELYLFKRARYAFAYYPQYRLNLLTGARESFSIGEWHDSLDFKVLDHQFKKRLIHLFYEFSKVDEIALMAPETLLSIDIEYLEVEKKISLPSVSPIELSLKKQLSFHEYEKKFQTGYEELVKGNCYQFNLTSDFLYEFKEHITPLDFISKLWSGKSARGAYGSATYSEVLKKLFLSNSPECLFNYKNNYLVTRPIKGTLKNNSKNKLELKKLWKQLSSDKKNEAELFMITDLLRNDLSSIDLPRSKVIAQKKCLLVPGLMHQYSEIAVELRSTVTLKKILSSLFPGGSITGAPKKRAMNIINHLEKRERGFYCGSSILLHNCEVSASINIRSSVICFDSYIISYSAGGGITLKSNPKSEYLEMSYKNNSYIDLLSR